MIRHNAGRRPCSRMFLSDSSGSGYSLLESGVANTEFWGAANFDERWRFRPVLKSADGPWSIAAAAETPECILLTGGDEDYRADQEVDSDGDVVQKRKPGGEAGSKRSRIMKKAQTERASWHTDREFEESDVHLPPLDDDLVAPGRWSRVVCGGWVRKEAIHNKEARASLLGLRRAAG